MGRYFSEKNELSRLREGLFHALGWLFFAYNYVGVLSLYALAFAAVTKRLEKLLLPRWLLSVAKDKWTQCLLCDYCNCPLLVDIFHANRVKHCGKVFSNFQD